MTKTLPKILVTLPTIWYGFIPIIADLNDSHLLNPSWMPHAKLHLAWLLSTNILLALFSLYLIWIKDKTVQAGWIGIFVMSGFWVAAFTRNLYGGLFVDPDLKATEILGLHPNVFAFIFVTLFLVVGTFLQRRVSKSDV